MVDVEEVARAQKWSNFCEEIKMVMEIHGRTWRSLNYLAQDLEWKETPEAEAFFKMRRDEFNICPCFDCNVSTIQIGEYYNVHKEIWEESGIENERGAPPHVYLCIGCLESRIGRILQPEDFGHCVINVDPLHYRSSRFCQRLGLPGYAE